MNIYFEHAEIFKLFRHRANLSMKEVADYIGKTPATIANYESGFTYPSVKNLSKLKKLYGEEFAHALTMINDHGKKPYLGFRGSASIPPSGIDSCTSFEQRHYPNIARIKEYLKEIDKNKKDQMVSV